MHISSADKTGRLYREALPDALHQVLFAWGKRLFSVSGISHAMVPEHAADAGQNASVRGGPVLMANVSLSNWQQQTLTQLTHALMLNLTKHGRDADASFVMHLHQVQREGEITAEQCLDRLQRLCPDEMAQLPTGIRAKISCIKTGIH